MSEGEVTRVMRELKALSEKADKQHEENRRAQAADRATFAQAMSEQRELFQLALNTEHLERIKLEAKVDQGNQLMSLCIGTGKPGEGRVGQLEQAVETLKKFRWQALAAMTTLLYLADKISSAVMAARH